ncbi:MAG: 2-phosphoglycerate kinase [Bacteroidota bacterium]
MIILLGGVSHTGKTYLAQQLLEKYNMPYLSLDHLKMGLIRGEVSCGFTIDDSDIEIANRMWPIVKGMIETNIENGQHLIIEGCYLPPDAVRALKVEHSSYILETYIGFADEYIAENFDNLILAHRNIIEKRKYKEKRSINDFTEEHAVMRTMCKNNSLKYFEVDSDYMNTINEVLAFLDGELTTSFKNNI